MPSPWEAIPHVRAATDVNLPVNICCFSPCIEQVHQTITALEEHGFTAIRMFEVLSKSYEVREVTMFDMGEAISKRDKRNFAQARNNKSKREQQADSTNNNDNTNNTNNNDNTTTTVVTGVKRKADDHEAEEENEENETTNPSTSAQEGSTLKSGLHTATTVTISKPATTMRGHTSYLTFAVLFPSSSSKTE